MTTTPEQNARYEASEKGRATRALHESRPERKAAKAAVYQACKVKHHERVARAREAGCADCEATEELDFHHVDPTTKDRNVVQMIGRSDEAFFAEVAKCVVLCRPCHINRHKESL